MQKKTDLPTLTRLLVKLSIAKKSAEDDYKTALDTAVGALPEGSTYTNSKGKESTGYKDSNGVLYEVNKPPKMSVDEDLLEKIGTPAERASYAKLLAKYGKVTEGCTYWQFKPDQQAVIDVAVEAAKEGT